MPNELTQWEYKTIKSLDIKESMDENLNKLGNEGWELTGTLSNENGDGRLLFKRPKQKTQDNYGYSR